MYRYVVANIDTGHPMIFTDDVMGAISKLSYLTNFEFGNIRVLGCLADSGNFIYEDFVIIDFECKEDLSHIRIIQSDGVRVPYNELVDEIKKSIRNIQISKIID